MATLTAAERAALESELTDLKAARTSLLKGERAEQLNYSERGVRFTGIKLEDLNNRIREIEEELAADAGTIGRRRPFSVQW